MSLYIPLLYRRELRRERNRCHYFDFFPALPSLRHREAFDGEECIEVTQMEPWNLGRKRKKRRFGRIGAFFFYTHDLSICFRTRCFLRKKIIRSEISLSRDICYALFLIRIYTLKSHGHYKQLKYPIYFRITQERKTCLTSIQSFLLLAWEQESARPRNFGRVPDVGC